MSRAAVVDAVLAVVFPRGIPARIAPLLDREAAARGLDRFKLGPVLALRGGPHRLTISDGGEATADWIARVERAWPDAGAAAFLSAPAERRMVDTDGVRGVLYLDDLGGEVMCRTLATDGERTVLARCPVERLPAFATPRFPGGFWAVRRRGDEATGALWVSESLHRGTAEASAALVDDLGGGDAWGALREAARAHGFTAYPDGIELGADGRVDVTVGFA